MWSKHHWTHNWHHLILGLGFFKKWVGKERVLGRMSKVWCLFIEYYCFNNIYILYNVAIFLIWSSFHFDWPNRFISFVLVIWQLWLLSFTFILTLSLIKSLFCLNKWLSNYSYQKRESEMKISFQGIVFLLCLDLVLLLLIGCNLGSLLLI